jgi:3-deoxy-D-manno-octulosonic-acid transferase
VLNTQTFKHSNIQTFKTAWFHAASLGEFEQARPVLEAFRLRHPDYKILVTFFSPSGYEVRKNYPLADMICYLPPDLPRNVNRLLNTVKPDIVFFVKYEFWFNYLNALRKRGVRTYIFSTIFRPDQYFFKWYGRWFRRQLGRCFTHLFVQNDESLQLLQSHGIGQCSLAGDTRFDRVHEIAEQAVRNELVEKWLGDTPACVLVAGSTWPPDEELLARFAKMPPRPLRIILAPHVINEEHLKQIEALFPNSIRYSRLSAFDFQQPTPPVLIIDNIGMLSQLYRYAHVAYIGGGFGVGSHNMLEAITFGKPVIFGPNYQKFKEASDIVALGGGWSISSGNDLLHTLGPLVADPRKREEPAKACLDYMLKNLGSTGIILKEIEQ